MCVVDRGRRARRHLGYPSLFFLAFVCVQHTEHRERGTARGEKGNAQTKESEGGTREGDNHRHWISIRQD